MAVYWVPDPTILKTFIATGVFSVELLASKFQCSALEISQDSSMYMHDAKLG